MKKIELEESNGNLNTTKNPVINIVSGDLVHIFKKGGSPFPKEGVYKVSIGHKICRECPFRISMNGYSICSVLRRYRKKTVTLCCIDARTSNHYISFKFKPIDDIMENL